MREQSGDRWTRQVRDWIDAAGQKTEEVARVSRRQVEMLQIDWELLRRKSDLGERLLRRLDQGDFPGWASDPLLADLVRTVRDLERRRREKSEEIRDIRERVSGRERPGP